MEIEATNYHMTLTDTELYTLGVAILRSISDQHNMQTHWCKFSVETWEKTYSDEIRLAKDIFEQLGKIHVFTGYYYETKSRLEACILHFQEQQRLG